MTLTQEQAHRLPIGHPEFRYVPSKNPYWGKIQGVTDGSALQDHDAEALRGRWRQAFADRGVAGSRLVVELGCNGGHVLNGWAEREPGSLHVGVDWKYKQIYFAAEKARKRGLKNAAYARAHGDRLPYLFGEGEVDMLAVYFPDPWPKKAQWKHRFLREEWFRRVAPVVRPGGELHIKTDHDGYFDWILEHVARVGDVWSPVDQTRDLHAGNPDPALLQIPDVTLFERLFIRDGIPIKSLRLLRRR
ncbi:MAG TPA: hypothetical protein VL588_01710 [Bdellovibrionota bacterium]|nr:hypothetical protein [Bdellovibrionota bacterium]